MAGLLVFVGVVLLLVALDEIVKRKCPEQRTKALLYIGALCPARRK